jgi:hypothetical protein
MPVDQQPVCIFDGAVLRYRAAFIGERSTPSMRATKP